MVDVRGDVLRPPHRTKVRHFESLSKSIGIINFERLSPNFIANTMNWFLNSVMD